MKEKNREEEKIREVNDENPENYTRFGNGHKEKIERKYTDGEPPHEEEEPYAHPDTPSKEIPKKRYI